MARAPKTTATSTSTEVANWDEELAKAASASAAMEAASGGGTFFSLKGGQLAFDGANFPNNEMAVVILDSIFENIFYEGKYDPNNLTPPTCYAFGRDDSIAPHPDVFAHKQEQNDVCAGCVRNQWGSADTGRGKACRNSRRLALISAGTFNKNGVFEPYESEDDFKSSSIGYLKLPVTSIKAYAGFVKQVASLMSRPPFGIFTKIKVIPDSATQFKVMFEALDKVPNHLMPLIMKRNKEAMGAIEFPYNLDAEAAPPQAPARGRGRNQAAAPAKAPARGSRKF